MKKSLLNSSYKLALPAAAAVGLIGATDATAQNNTFSPGTSAITPITQSVELGPVLDVVPYVLADGYTINLALLPSDTEFSGYDTQSAAEVGLALGAVGNLNVVELPTVLPIFTVRQLVTTVNVWDNQTVVLGGLITSTMSETKNSVPIVGDIPVVGRLFQSQSKTTARDNLMIFVTATIVDPAGQRVHSDDELPFAINSFPVQTPGNVAPTLSTNTIRISGSVQSSVP
jgi:general secretion pathway protein D